VQSLQAKGLAATAALDYGSLVSLREVKLLVSHRVVITTTAILVTFAKFYTSLLHNAFHLLINAPTVRNMSEQYLTNKKHCERSWC